MFPLSFLQDETDWLIKWVFTHTLKKFTHGFTYSCYQSQETIVVFFRAQVTLADFVHFPCMISDYLHKNKWMSCKKWESQCRPLNRKSMIWLVKNRSKTIRYQCDMRMYKRPFFPVILFIPRISSPINIWRKIYPYVSYTTYEREDDSLKIHDKKFNKLLYSCEQIKT